MQEYLNATHMSHETLLNENYIMCSVKDRTEMQMELFARFEMHDDSLYSVSWKMVEEFF